MIFTQLSALVFVATVPVRLTIFSRLRFYHYIIEIQWTLASSVHGGDISRRQTDLNVPPLGWKYVGCYKCGIYPKFMMQDEYLKYENSDSDASARTLSGSSKVDSKMTPAFCTDFCQGGILGINGYNFAGTEFADECCEFQFKSLIFRTNLINLICRLWFQYSRKCNQG